MRALTTEVLGIPAGTLYDVYEAVDNTARVRWLIKGIPHGGNVRNPGNIRARDLYAAHLETLGINDGEVAPCGNCGSAILATLTVCSRCQKDPDTHLIPCPRCHGSGVVEYGGLLNYRAEECPDCEGRTTAPAPYATARGHALKQARAWKLAQRVEQVPAGIGEKNRRKVVHVASLRGFDDERQLEELECGHRFPADRGKAGELGADRECRFCAQEDREDE